MENEGEKQGEESLYTRVDESPETILLSIAARQATLFAVCQALVFHLRRVPRCSPLVSRPRVSASRAVPASEMERVLAQDNEEELGV